MTNRNKWDGRVRKHNPDARPPFGKEENKTLLQHYYPPLEVEASKDDEGLTVRELLEKTFGISSKLMAQVRVTEYGLTINEERVYSSAPVEAGEIIRLRMLREQSVDILPQHIPIDIVYEDEYLLIINKPAGMVVHPTHGHYVGTLANAVVYHWQEKGEQYRFRPIHRLDEETSGLVAIAKNSYIHQQLSEQLQHDGVDKRYIAFVHGNVSPIEGMIDAPIDRDEDQPHLRVVRADGYPSRTSYHVVESYLAASKVSLKLYTGRTHQIRVHMKSIGHPLIGDKLYSDKSIHSDLDQNMNRHALHAAYLAFTHPMTRKYVEWEAALPPDLIQLQQQLTKGLE